MGAEISVNQGDEKSLDRSNDSSLGPFFHHLMTSNHVGKKEVQQDGQKLHLEHLLLQNTPQSAA